MLYDHGRDYGHMVNLMNRSIKASECKAKFLSLIEDISSSGESVTVTKRGKPLVDMIPHRTNRKDAFGILKGRIKIKGDIISPVDVEWDAMK
jgi:antitoxin (DNA-binding transcriptional repressor) of toxin-antitoxin stability system